MNRDRTTIVGIGLAYPDASTPEELWANVLAGRRAFRDIPRDRTSLDDYWSEDADLPDRFYSRKAAVLRDYSFSRVDHRVSARTFRVTDMTHWLALDVVGQALADAGFPRAEGLPLESTGVVLGNTLTGEFTRASLMRLRWPYVRRTIASRLVTLGWGNPDIDSLIHDLEADYKAPFPVPNEDSLAGGLANTIAGRVCNYFDFGGGGYTVDGACSSSLLSITQACAALASHDLDVAIAGGVDLSIDPFELVGFSRTGALATGEMRVYDAESNGFWPGEGCGILVLMREGDAIAQGRNIYACISGWGVSSDGKGGITRPEAAGHVRAIERAYRRAGYGAESVGYFEGHGTGTAVGDATEIGVLASTRRGAGSGDFPAALGTIKANIGHTKAAAGVAGVIKAALAVHHQLVPPISGHYVPHPTLLEAKDRLYTPREVGPWPGPGPVRAGVSAMGFGGINSHVALESVTESPVRIQPSAPMRALVRGRQDAEVILLGADDTAGLVDQVQVVRDWVAKAAMCELSDVAASTCQGSHGKRVRAAVVARNVEEAVERLTKLQAHLEQSAAQAGQFSTGLRRVGPGTYFGVPPEAPRLGFVFPGQATGTGHRGAALRRFGTATDTSTSGADDTQDLQPQLVASCVDSV